MLGRWRLLLKASPRRSEELNDRNCPVPIREVPPRPVGKFQEVVTFELFHFLDCGTNVLPCPLANHLEVAERRRVALTDEFADSSPRGEPPTFVPVLDAAGRDVKAVYLDGRANAEGLREFGQARPRFLG